MSRRTGAVFILAAWVGALGWLAQRHYLGGPGETASHWPVPPGASFHSVRLGARQYGLGSLTIDTLPEGYRVTELLTLDLPEVSSSSLRRTSSRVEGLYTRGLQLTSWRSDLLTERGKVASIGRVSGDTLLTVINEGSGEATETLTVHLRRPIALPSAISLIAASRGLPKPGDKLNLEIYDPLDHELRTERLVVAAESVFTVSDSAEFNQNLRRWQSAHADTIRAWRFDAVEHGLPMSRWVDAAGMIVREDHPLGARLDRSAFEIVNNNFRALPAPHWDSSAAAPRFVLADGEEPPGRGLTLVATLAGGQPIPAVVPSLDGGWQQRSGDTLRIAPRSTADTVTEAPGTVEVLIGDAASVAGAAAIVTGPERRPEAVARKLTDWIRRTITLRDGPGIESAARTLALSSGSSVERVTLLVAMARAAGLEARPVWGLVHLNHQWQLRPWAEFRAGGWTPMDPAAAGPEAGLSRVRLATSGRPRLLDLALRAGRLRLEVLEDSP
jgi:Transglutaminase-like superfamily